MKKTLPSPHSIPSVFDPECSARDALELISGKWSVLVMSALADGALRNGALLRKIGGISQKMLTQTLKDLERNGLVERRDFATMPLNVEYRLSPLGISLSQVLTGLDRWAELNFPELDEARARYDAARKSGR